jgi:hypothetical protein
VVGKKRENRILIKIVIALRFRGQNENTAPRVSKVPALFSFRRGGDGERSPPPVISATGKCHRTGKTVDAKVGRHFTL